MPKVVIAGIEQGRFQKGGSYVYSCQKERTIVPIFQEHNDRIQALVPTGEFAQGTVERYKTTLNHFKSFLESKFK